MNLATPRGRGLVRLILALIALTMLPAAPARAYEKEMKELATDLSKMIKASGKRAVAVVDFTDLEGNTTALGRFLAEELSNSLAASAKDFDVIDRNHLNTLMREQQLTSSGLLNRLMTRKLEVDGVQALVTGSLTPFGEEEVRVSVKILDVSTAKMLGVNQVNLVQNATIKNMMRQGIAANEVATASRPAGAAPVAVAPASNASSIGTVPASGTAENPPQRLAEAQRVWFEVRGCDRTGESLECHVTTLNRGAARALEITQEATRIFDEAGNEYRPWGAQIANTVQNELYYHRISKDILADVPVEVTLRFKGILPDSKQVRVLQMGGEIGNLGFGINVENVPLNVTRPAGLGVTGGGTAEEGEVPAGGGLLNGLKRTLQNKALKVFSDKLDKYTGGSNKSNDDSN